MIEPMLVEENTSINNGRRITKTNSKKYTIALSFISISTSIVAMITFGFGLQSSYTVVEELSPPNEYKFATEPGTEIPYDPQNEFQTYFQLYLKNTKVFWTNPNFNLTQAFIDPVGEVTRFNLNESLAYSWRINNVKKSVFDKTTFFNIEKIFPLKGYDLNGKVRLGTTERDGVFISFNTVSINTTSVKGADDLANIAVVPKITIVLRDMNQIDGFDQSRFITQNVFFDSPFNHVHLFHQSKKAVFNSPLYVVNGSITLDIYVEPPYVAKQAFSDNGVLMWELKNYWQRNMTYKYRFIPRQASPYFYTSPNGYRVQAVVGVDIFTQAENQLEATSITVAISFLKGNNDRTLDYDFPHTTSVTIFNQKDPSLSLVHSTEKNIKQSNSYLIGIATRYDLENDGYMVNGALLYKIVIQKSKHKDEEYIEFVEKSKQFFTMLI